MLRLSLPLLIGLAACAPIESGRVLQVRPSPDGELDDASLPATAWTGTIQSAITASSSGDTVIIPAGTYYEDIVVNRGITLQGAGPGETIIVGTVATGDGYAGLNIRGMSIWSPTWVSTGVVGVEAYGMHTVSSTAVMLSDLDIRGFQRGVFMDSGSGVYVYDSTLTANWYGVHSEDIYQTRVYDSLITFNSKGGIVVAWNSEYDSDLACNTLVGNGFGASSGDAFVGAIVLGGSFNINVQDNIIVSNAIGFDCDGCTFTANNNIVWGNTTDYVNDASRGSTDLNVDPLFRDAAEADFHLSGSSPAIDAGVAPAISVASDFDGEARPQGGGFDIGYDEYAISATELVISEVMANPLVEDAGEFVEIYNAGAGPVDLAGLMLSDGDDTEVLQAWGSSVTILGPGGHAMIIDAEYDGAYGLDSSIPLLTTDDTNLGNGLTTSDPVALFESDGSTIISGFSHPFDPGNGISVELYDLAEGDTSGNWRASHCASGHSAGTAHCFPVSGDATGLVITEVMNNAIDESTGEYVELHNPSASEIDLAGLYLYDGDSWDLLVSWQGGPTLLGSQQHALVLDPDFAGEYHPPAGTVLVTTSDNSLGNGLSASSDPVYLYAADQTTLIDSFSHLVDAGNGISWEKVDHTAGDVAGNWVRATDTCTSTSSPGRLNAATGGLCGSLLISEVLSNALDEDAAEFVEIYNAGDDTVDLAGLVLSDGDAIDTLRAWQGGATLLGPGAYAVILDAEYVGEHEIDAAAILLTTNDTSLGNGLATTDEIRLLESDGVHEVDAFLHPSNPGNGVSAERQSFAGIDAAANWSACTCPEGSSPGLSNCAGGSSNLVSDLDGIIVITEIMANPASESTGEFVELYNDGKTSVDLAGFVLYDGDAVDTIQGFTDPTDTILQPLGFAVILDANYAGEYSILAGTLLLTTDDSALASGLAVDDPVYLYEPNGISVVDGYSWPIDPGDGLSVEKRDLLFGDRETNWAASACASGSSPGNGPCFP